MTGYFFFLIISSFPILDKNDPGFSDEPLFLKKVFINFYNVDTQFYAKSI